MIQDLIDLKLLYPTGSKIYDSEIGDYDLLKEGITIVAKFNRDNDPALEYRGYTSSVVVEYRGEYYKSNDSDGSYGAIEWLEWLPVQAKPVIMYHYNEEYV